MTRANVRLTLPCGFKHLSLTHPGVCFIIFTMKKGSPDQKAIRFQVFASSHRQPQMATFFSTPQVVVVNKTPLHTASFLVIVALVS